ncbi:hypothetical protein F66182_12029, partial [Fusarium sp. NRRL 66182]
MNSRNRFGRQAQAINEASLPFYRQKRLEEKEPALQSISQALQDLNQTPSPQLIPLSMKASQNIQLRQQIAVILRKLGPFTGWRAEVAIPDRAGKIFQLMTSVALIQPKQEVLNALPAAFAMEDEAFCEANQRDEYEQKFTSKLHAVEEMRLRQQAV